MTKRGYSGGTRRGVLLVGLNRAAPAGGPVLAEGAIEGPLADEGPGPHNKATFEPAIEYVGNRSIIAILRDATANRFTWQTVSMDMGLTFGQLKDISSQVDGGVTNGLWQRARLFKESNPCFQRNNCLDYSKGEGRLWGFGIHSNGGGYTRKPVVYWSDDNGRSWQGPQIGRAHV